MFKNGFENTLLILYMPVVNSKRLFIFEKLVLDIGIVAFWYTN